MYSTMDSTSWRWEFSCQAGGKGCGTRLHAGPYEIKKDSVGYYATCPACTKKNYVPKGLVTKLFLDQFAKKV